MKVALSLVVCFCAVAMTRVECEAPLSSYGVPGAGFAPNSQYGVPGGGFGSFGGRRVGGFGSHGGGRFGGVSGGFGGQHSGNFGGQQVGGNFGSQRGGNFGGQHGGNFGSQRGGNFGRQNGGNFGGQHNGNLRGFGGYASGGHSGGFGGYTSGNSFGGFSNNEFSGDAKYSFSYEVKDPPSGNDYGHKESRDGEVAKGSYHVLLPDGRQQTVDYVADQGGYKPTVAYKGEAKFGATGGSGYFYRR